MRAARFAFLALAGLATGAALAGGGVVLRDDTCIITIGFYEAHFTAYQPATRGDREFCEDLPDAAQTIFVLDYLHASLAQVPVDFRIIDNVTGKGEFARIEDVEALADIDAHTVFYQPPVVRPDGSFMIEHEFTRSGEYVGIVTAGHPTTDAVYTSVFPFAVGRTSLPWGWIGLALALAAFAGFVARLRHVGRGADS